MNVNGRLEQSRSVSPSCSSSPRVSFDEMTCGYHEARRISTCNSLLEPDFSLATEWLWYWEDERGKWNLYASPVSQSGSSVIIKQIQHTAQPVATDQSAMKMMAQMKSSSSIIIADVLHGWQQRVSCVAGRWTRSRRRGQLRPGAEVSERC